MARLDHQIRLDGLRRWREMNVLGFSADHRHPGDALVRGDLPHLGQLDHVRMRRDATLAA
jgi:hypothetical protein